ncbi:MAG: YqaA family protein [Campylobacterota bacterium]|nr:YqaA family protein [Campylobacterota bacterium]
MDFIYLFVFSFAAATILPLGSEALLLYQLSNGLNIYLLLLFATLGNTFGSILNYVIGYKGEEYLERKKILKYNKIKKYKSFFDRYGGYTLLLSWVPIIGDPITLVAGGLKYNFKKFVFIVLISKFFRYLFIILSFLYLS